MNNKPQIDFLHGGILKSMLRFTLPLLFANILQSCYGMVDMAVVGQFTGPSALAAVSSAARLIFTVEALCGGITMGGTVLVSQYRGAQNRDGQRKTIGTFFTASIFMAFSVAVVEFLIFPFVFQFMNLPADAMPYAIDYMQIICPGVVFMFAYNAVCAVLRGLGDSKGPLVFVAVSSLVNVALDVLFVGAWGLGTRGAALATVTAQCISAVTALVWMRRRCDVFEFRRTNFHMDQSICKKLFRIGLPSALQGAVLNFSYLLVTGMFNLYGVAVAAAAGIGLNVNTFSAMPCWAVGRAVTTMAGQCMGAQNPDRAAKAAKVGLWLAVGSSFVMMIGIQLFLEPLIRLFNTDPDVIRAGVEYLRICCSVNFLPYAAMYLYDCFATGVGDSLFAMINAFLQSVVIRLLLSWLFSVQMGFGAEGLYWAEFLSPILPCAAGVVYFYMGRWRRNKLILG